MTKGKKVYFLKFLNVIKSNYTGKSNKNNKTLSHMHQSNETNINFYTDCFIAAQVKLRLHK